MRRALARTAGFLLVGMSVGVLAGCAGGAGRSEPLYEWGNFPEQQYAYFKGDRGAEESIALLEKTRETARSEGKRLPPGFQAHLGVLYGQVGRSDLFEQSLLAERQQFPESAAFVDFLLKRKNNPAKVPAQ